jgi:hypothetical protein
MNQGASVFCATVVALTLVGCKSKGAAPSGDTLALPPVRAGSASATTPPAGAPAPVEQAEGLAEDVQTDLTQNAWPAAEAKLRELRSLGGRLDSAGVSKPKQSAYRQAVDSLGVAITRRSQAGAPVAGNYVSRIVTGIVADHPTKVPVEVLE